MAIWVRESERWSFSMVGNAVFISKVKPHFWLLTALHLSQTVAYNISYSFKVVSKQMPRAALVQFQNKKQNKLSFCTR